jgi:drug/metabolite transporter (DMT)-like permease
MANLELGRTSPAVTPHALTLPAASLLTFCCMIWGAGLVMVKIANTGISPIMNAGLRSIVAGCVLLLWARWRGIAIFTRDGSLWAGLAAGAIFAVEFVALYTGLDQTTAARGIVFLHCAPFVAAAGEHFLVPGHRLSGVRIAGLLAAFAGLALAFAEGMTGADASTLRGDLLCLVGGIMWGLITVLMKTTSLGQIAPERGVLYQLAVSALLLPVLSLAVGETGITALSAPIIGAFAYTALLTVAFGYTVWFWLMRIYSAASMHAFTFMTPIFGAIAGAVFLGEQIGSWTLAGLGLVALGIYLVNRPTIAARPS